MNDQENADLHADMPDDSIPEESFNEQHPSHLSSGTESHLTKVHFQQ